jgi:hypothetical protein
MTTWTPPETVHLFSNDCGNVVDGLLRPDSRADALAFVGTLEDDGLLRVIACQVAYEQHRPKPEVVDGDTYRALIREWTAVTA